MKCFGLIGNPLGHSFSPLIHKHLFGIKNIDASYKLLETTPENLKKRIDELKSGEYDGFNVTGVPSIFTPLSFWPSFGWK